MAEAFIAQQAASGFTAWSILPALVGAAAGAILTYFLQRPSGVAHIDNIQMTTTFPSPIKNVIFDSALVERIDSYPTWLTNYDLSKRFRSESVSEKDYVESLHLASQRLTYEMDGRLPRLLSFVASVRQLCMAQDFVQLDRQLARDGDEMWKLLCVSIMRQEFAFSEEEPRNSQEQPALKIFEAQYSDPGENGNFPYYVIPIAGPSNILLYSGRIPTAHQELVSNQAKRFAQAIAYRNTAEIIAVCDHLRDRLESDAKTGKALHGDIELAMVPYLRIAVSGILSNPSRSPVSFTSRGRLTVEMRGYRTAAGVIEDDVDILLHISIGDATIDEPILVGAGASIRFTGVSVDTIDASRQPKALRSVFEGGSQGAYLTLGAMSRRNGEFSASHSRPVLFRDLLQSAELPRKRRRPFRRG